MTAHGIGDRRGRDEGWRLRLHHQALKRHALVKAAEGAGEAGARLENQTLKAKLAICAAGGGAWWPVPAFRASAGYPDLRCGGALHRHRAAARRVGHRRRAGGALGARASLPGQGHLVAVNWRRVPRTSGGGAVRRGARRPHRGGARARGPLERGSQGTLPGCAARRPRPPR